jgi:hypothetical protein
MLFEHAVDVATKMTQLQTQDSVAHGMVDYRNIFVGEINLPESV